MAETPAVEMKPTLGLTGLTMNAMALIAPGAFLWLTFYIQATTGVTSPVDVDRHRRRAAAVFGHGRVLRGDGETLSGNGQLVLFRRAVFSQSQHGVALCAAFEVYRRLGVASLLLDLSRRDGRRHGYPVRIPGGDDLAECHERVQPRTDVHDGGCDRLLFRGGLHRLPWRERIDRRSASQSTSSRSRRC